LLKKYNMEQMQQKGFKLTAEDIYDINNASLKDAVGGLVRLSNPFHHFCSGQIISDQALVLTNHHCAFGAIQTHSSLENDYLTNGFWAMNKDEELANEGIGISFLKRMEDVTDKVLATIPENADAAVRDSIIAANILALEKEAVAETHYMAKIKPFYSGNAYYLSVCEVFRDIRLVGAPPSAIGKFGGDTDNWMWPRHTGDFALLRIYVNNENKPADYSSENVPYKPIKHLEISLEGIKKHPRDLHGDLVAEVHRGGVAEVDVGDDEVGHRDRQQQHPHGRRHQRRPGEQRHPVQVHPHRAQRDHRGRDTDRGQDQGDDCQREPGDGERRGVGFAIAPVDADPLADPRQGRIGCGRGIGQLP
jgi:hypothetical protein